MARTLVALYDYFDDAQDAVQDLIDNDVPKEEISLTVRAEQSRARTVAGTEEEANLTAAGNVGGSLGDLLVGLGVRTVPELGTVVAAGPLADGLMVGGDLTGSLTAMGLPDEEAEWYAEGIKRGGALVAVRAPDAIADDAIEILEDYEPVDIRRRVEEWRAQGWRPAGHP